MSNISIESEKNMNIRKKAYLKLYKISIILHFQTMGRFKCDVILHILFWCMIHEKLDFYKITIKMNSDQ